MIDLNRSCVIIHANKGCQVDYRMVVFFTNLGLPLPNITAVDPKDFAVVQVRNRTIIQNVLPRVGDFDWFIFVDHDHFPREGNLTEMFLDDVPADIVGCTYDTGNERSWLQEDQFHMGMVRIRPDVFTQMAPPYFMFEYNEDGTQITSCECGMFRKKAKELGFRIVRRGLVGHTKTNSGWHWSA